MTLPGFEFKQGYQSIEFFIEGRAVPKRFIIATFGKKDDPEATRIIKADSISEKWMDVVEAEARSARAVFSEWVIPEKDVAVVVTITILKGMAPSWPMAKQLRLNGKRCYDAPDLDNVINCIHDALQGHRKKLKPDASPGEVVVWESWKPPVILNDKQIAEEHIYHRWCWPNEDGLRIKVEVPGDE